MKTLHRWIAWGFVLITLAYTARVGYDIGYYVAFKESYVAKFCVNKNKPLLKCDGKCELAKLLQQAPSQEDQIPTLSFTGEQLYWQIVDVPKIKQPISTESLLQHLGYPEGTPSDFNQEKLDPPRGISSFAPDWA